MAPSPPADAHRPTPFLERTVVREVALVAVVAALQLGVMTFVAVHQEGRGSIPAAGYVLLVVGVAAVPFRRRAPVAALWISFLATLAYWSVDYPPGPAFASLVVLLAHALLVGRRTAALVVVGVGYLAFPWLGWAIGRRAAPPWASMLVLAAWLVTLVAVVEAVRSRRARAREAARSQAEVVRRQAADERLRIARELHDVVAHNMSLISVQAGVALHLMGDDAPAPARDALVVIKDASRDALVELRSILGVLRQVDEEVPHRPAPSLDHLDELIERSEAAGVRVRLDDDGRRALGALPRDIDLAAYRIVQESLTNVARHADPPDATVRIRPEGGALLIEVVDEGSGRSSRGGSEGGANGIAGMAERASAVGGSFQAGPRPGRGFAVRASLPLPAPAAAPVGSGSP